MQPYSIYGHFYDATQKRDASSYLSLLRKHHPRARTLLEIACGTGAHLLPLSEHYDVEGLDISRTMLRYACETLPGVRFHHQDMAGFRVSRKFDAVICPYDSINHLLTFRDWIRTFNAARRHLNPGGVFIFDINTVHRLRTLANSASWVRTFGKNYVVMKVSKAEKGVVGWDVQVLERVRARQYRLHREVIRERSFAHGRIMTALKGCFGRVRAYDGKDWSRPKASSARLFYVAVSPLAV